ncbi:MAG: hypothetical protein WC796_02705 [Candidatus Pacearchaeota archaeon]|jgi:hypothetical protein
MGFFNKNKENNEVNVTGPQQVPQLPAVPEPPQEMQEVPMEEDFNIPELPAPPSMRSYSLPSYPNSGIGQRMSQEAVKGAVIQEEDLYPGTPSYMPQIPRPNPMKTRTMEIDEFKPRSFPQRPMDMNMNKDVDLGLDNTEQLPTWVMPEPRQTQPRVKKTEPLFIKLDKFESTISTFNEVRLRVSEIESLLKNIRAIKAKEEKELNDWEKELEVIKSRLDQIDHEMFKGI